MDQVNTTRVEKRGDVACIDIQGDLTASSEPFLNDAYAKACDCGTNRILFTFDPDAYINNGGIAILIQIIAEGKKRDQQIGITGISDHFKKIFALVGITKFATIYPTAQDGLNDLAGPD